MEYFYDKENATVPVVFQLRDKPHEHSTIGRASPKLTPLELLEMFNLKKELDAKFVRRGDGDKWVITLD